MRPPRLRCALFPLIYPPHLLVLPATFGLHLFGQTYPYFRALYVISVRRTKSLLTASFRFHLTMNTLAVQLYTSSLPRRVRDLHPLERAHGAQTQQRKIPQLFQNLKAAVFFPLCRIYMNHNMLCIRKLLFYIVVHILCNCMRIFQRKCSIYCNLCIDIHLVAEHSRS